MCDVGFMVLQSSSRNDKYLKMQNNKINNKMNKKNIKTEEALRFRECLKDLNKAIKEICYVNLKGKTLNEISKNKRLLRALQSLRNARKRLE